MLLLYALLVPLALCDFSASLAASSLSLDTPFLALPQQPLNASSSPLSKRWSCHPPKQACGDTNIGCYNPHFSRCCATPDEFYGLCPLDMTCCDTSCCPEDTTCYSVVDGVEGLWCWPNGLPQNKNQIPTSALNQVSVARVTGMTNNRIKNGGARPRAPALLYLIFLLVPFVVGNLSMNTVEIARETSTSTIRASIPATTPDIQTPSETQIDIDLSEKKGFKFRPAGGGAHSGATRPAIPRMFRALVMLKFAVADSISAVTQSVSTELGDELDVDLSEKGGGGRGGGGSSGSKSNAARPAIPSLFHILTLLKASGATPHHPSPPTPPLSQQSTSHRLEPRGSCHPPKMTCGSGCYNANNSTCCYTTGWRVTGICPWPYDCCAGFCCEEGWTCHEVNPDSDSICWPPGYTDSGNE
jgi:hypothetical protein